MKKLIFLLMPVLMASCVKSVSDYDTPKNPEKPWNEFDFRTSASTSISLDYAADAEVYFEIYDTTPVRENESGTAYEKIEGIEPLYAGITDEKGRFSAQVELPAYLGKAYVYTPNVHAQTLLVAEKTGGVLTASAVSEAAAAAMSVTRGGGVRIGRRDRRRLENMARDLRRDLRPDQLQIQISGDGNQPEGGELETTLQGGQ